MASQAKDAYRRISRIYEAVIDPIDAPLRSIGMKLFPVKPDIDVLDVGCGTGAHLALYQSAGCHVHGIDLSPSMLELSRKRLGDTADLQLGDATALPYPDASFDLIVSSLFLHELEVATRASSLEEMARTLKTDGRVLIIDFHAGHLRFPKGWLIRGLSFLIERLAGRNHFHHFREFVGVGGIPELVSAAGFMVEREKVVSGGNMGLYLLRTRPLVA